MIVNYPNSTLSSIERLLHEEEVRYNEASRMKAETDILQSIQQEIEFLKAELHQQKSKSLSQTFKVPAFY